MGLIVRLTEILGHTPTIIYLAFPIYNYTDTMANLRAETHRLISLYICLGCDVQCRHYIVAQWPKVTINIWGNLSAQNPTLLKRWTCLLAQIQRSSMLGQ